MRKLLTIAMALLATCMALPQAGNAQTTAASTAKTHGPEMKQIPSFDASALDKTPCPGIGQCGHLVELIRHEPVCYDLRSIAVGTDHQPFTCSGIR